MKRVLFIITMLSVVLTACDTEQMKYGQGGRNACQFIREKVPELRDDIAKVEVIAEDSLLSDIGLIFAETQLAKSGAEFLDGKMTKERYLAIIDSIAHDATDVSYSWQFSSIYNDSIKGLQRYVGQWRKVYTVRVTMKSGTTKEPRVLMDEDGVTPRMMERDMGKTLEDFTQKIIEAQQLMYY